MQYPLWLQINITCLDAPVSTVKGWIFVMMHFHHVEVVRNIEDDFMYHSRKGFVFDSW